MSSFVSLQGSGAPAPAPNGPTSGHMSEKPPPVPWQQLVSTFKTTSEAKPGTALLIVANTTLEQDKATVLRCWLAMGGKEDDLRRGYFDTPMSPNVYLRQKKMRAEPSDDVSEWFGVTVEGERVTALEWMAHKLWWGGEGLPGIIPAEIGALSALTRLFLFHNKLNGALPPTIGALSSLITLSLDGNSLSGAVPYSIFKLPNLKAVNFSDNNLSNNQNRYLHDQREIQDYFTSLWRHPTIRLFNCSIAITKKRQVSLGRRISPHCAVLPPHPFFAFLADHEHTLTYIILSYLDPWFCCNKDRTAVLKCWESLGGAKDTLIKEYGDDVTRWKGVTVENGRVVKVYWGRMGLTGHLTSEIGELDCLRHLCLHDNEIGSIPTEVGKLSSLTFLDLHGNQLTDLPRELGNLRSLTDLSIGRNGLSILPSTLANLTNLKYLSLYNNNFSIDVPKNFYTKGKIQTFLATLKSTGKN